MGYTHALKIRSDYLPTNAKNFVKLFDFDKLVFLMWHYTTFLWVDYPTLKGYFNDHFCFGPIDYMLELWDIKINFCHSPEILLTWSYITKLKDKIDLKYILNDLNEDNDIYYIKFNNQEVNNIFAHNIINNNFGNRELYGRYESVFKGKTEYIKTVEETKKYLTNKYINFLTYFNFLPEITVFINTKINLDKIIYPKNKINQTYNTANIREYVIFYKDIENETTLIIEYFKKIDRIYSSTITSEPNPGNTIDKMLLFNRDEFLKNKKTII